jgi:predicted AAA+ superfamily ATPase
MKRNFDNKLLKWKNGKNKKPLVVFGARQIGKTHTIEKFAKEQYDNYVVFNFEDDKSLKNIFDENLLAQNIITQLEIRSNVSIEIGKTLIFFDEIQDGGNALTSLKYFYEQLPNLDIICAGSLLGVSINKNNVSFPVGKVQKLDFYPMSFDEFLLAIGKEKLCNYIRDSYQSFTPLGDIFHNEALEMLKIYFLLGGMPEVIKTYISTKSVTVAREVQKSILYDYEKDMTKYATNNEAVKIKACFNSIPIQLAKDNQKFQYKVVKKGGSSSYFGTSIEWLLSAGLINQQFLLNAPIVPLGANLDLTNFKIYMLDIGLLNYLSGSSQKLVLDLGQNDKSFLGPISENYISCVLKQKNYSLQFWRNEGEAELDFIIDYQDFIIPVEVKAGKRVNSPSLKIYKNTYNPEFSIRFSAKNFGYENNIKSIPLYAAFCLEQKIM